MDESREQESELTGAKDNLVIIMANEEQLKSNLAELESEKEAREAYVIVLESENAAHETYVTQLESENEAQVIIVSQLESENAAIQASMDQADRDRYQIESELQAQIDERDATITAQQATIEQQSEEAQITQAQIEKIVGVRTELIEELYAEFGEDLQVNQDTGAITFDSTVLFDKNKHDLKEPGKEFLEDFLPRYIEILTSDRFMDHIAEIIVEGHTDSDGDYMFNLKLSQARALAVAEYLIGDTGAGKDIFSAEQKEQLKKIVTYSGRADSMPIYTDGKYDKDKSRRVEIHFRLKDEEMIQQMMAIINGSNE